MKSRIIFMKDLKIYEIKEPEDQIYGNQIVDEAFQSYPDKIKKETIENLTETLLYDRIGTYLRK